jgi:phospholipid/cholesterol/gamma-HCH transport system substrate-binding protein
MESTFKAQLKVGLFMAVGLAVLLTSILLLGGDSSLFKSTYALVTQFREVQGLGPGSVVSVAGLPVGNVRQIDFTAEGDLVQVTMDIEKKYQNRITETSLAEVRTQGALGDKYVYIAPGKAGGRVLRNGDILSADLSAGFLEVISEKGKDFVLAADVIKEVHQLLVTINSEGRARKLVDNMVTSSQDLKQVLGETRLLISDIRGHNEKDNNLRESLAHLSNILEKVDRGDGTLGALINNKALHDRILALLGDSPRNQYLKPLIRDSIKSRDKK